MNKENAIKLLIQVAKKAQENGLLSEEENILVNEAISLLELTEMEVQSEIIDINTTQEVGGGTLTTPRHGGNRPKK